MANNSASKKSKSSSKNSQDQQKQTRKPGELTRFQKVVIVLFVVVFAMSTLAGALASVFQSSQSDQTVELTVDNIDSQFESTVADLENTVSENPEDTTSLRSLGDNYMTWGSYVKVLAKNDADTEHSNELFEKAISAYDKILELGDDSDVRINRAMCQSYMGDYDGSIAALTELTEAEPDNASAWLNLGVVYRRTLRTIRPSRCSTRPSSSIPMTPRASRATQRASSPASRARTPPPTTPLPPRRRTSPSAWAV